MQKKKIMEEFIDYGCGFPVIFRNLPMIKIQGKWIPDINYNDLEKTILILLCHKPFKLTGNELRFIRLYFEMTLQEFAKRFGVQHPTIIKWENFKDDSTNMSLGTEKDIRLFIINHVLGLRQVGKLYKELENTELNSKHSEPIEIDMEQLAC